MSYAPTDPCQEALDAYNKGDLASFLRITLSLIAGGVAGRVYFGINVSDTSGSFSPEALKVFAIFSGFVNGVLYADATSSVTKELLLPLESLDIKNKKIIKKINKNGTLAGLVCKAGKWYIDLNMAFSSASFLFKTTCNALDKTWAYSALALEMFLITPSVVKTTNGIVNIFNIIRGKRESLKDDMQTLTAAITDLLKEFKEGSAEKKEKLLSQLTFLGKSLPGSKDFEKGLNEALKAVEKSRPAEYRKFNEICKIIFGTSTLEQYCLLLSVGINVLYGPSMMSDIQAGNKMYPLWLSIIFALTSLPTKLTDSLAATTDSSLGLMIILTKLTKEGLVYLCKDIGVPMWNTLKMGASALWNKTWSAGSALKYGLGTLAGAVAGVGIGAGLAFLFSLPISPVVLGCSAALGLLPGATAVHNPTFLLHSACTLFATLSVISSIKLAVDGAEFSEDSALSHFLKAVKPLLTALGIATGITFNSTGMSNMIEKLREWIGMVCKTGSYFGYSLDEKALVMAREVLETYSRMDISASAADPSETAGTSLSNIAAPGQEIEEATPLLSSKLTDSSQLTGKAAHALTFLTQYSNKPPQQAAAP